MDNKESNFDYDDMNDDLELREKGEGGSYWWILWVVILVIIVVGGFFLLQGKSDTPLLDWGVGNDTPATEESKSVVVEEMDLVMRESFPVQIAAQIRGTLTDECTEISDISQLRDGNVFYVDIQAGEKMICEVGGELAPVEYIDSIELETIGLPAGTYMVNVNGLEDTFTLQVDNEINVDAGEQK